MKAKHFGYLALGLSLVSLIYTVIVMKDGGGMSIGKVILLVLDFSLFMGAFGLMLWSASLTTRTKALKWLVPICASLVLVDVTLKFLRLPSAAIQVILGTFAFAFIVGPVVARNRYDQWKSRVDSKVKLMGMMCADSMGFSLIALGLLFWMQKWPLFSLWVFIGLVLLIAASIFWNDAIRSLFDAQERAKQALEKAHDEITEKNKEITDSITYAQRIQEAILPPLENFDKYLPDHFLLYLPKDIVAGDFYWMGQANGITLFAAADCTGHGVPGAMVSVICSNALNKSVNEFKLSDPGEVLDQCLLLVKERFAEAAHEVRDGMDIALCAWDAAQNKLMYAGANNPLWMIKSTGECLEIKATKQPIGNYQEPVKYQCHELSPQAGDIVYLFSDGFPDQFGGERGKKLKSKGFREYLMSIQSLSMSEQKAALESFFKEWRGENEQIDDVCVIGVRF